MEASLDEYRESLNALPRAAELGDYIVEQQLGGGGFSIVYLARNKSSVDRFYAIKEFFPRESAVRAPDGLLVTPVSATARRSFEDGLRRFGDEAEQLRRFSEQRHILSCVDYLELNGTAYLIMHYDNGMSLHEFLLRREEVEQPLLEEELLDVVTPLLGPEGLATVHRLHVLHRDIKPANIFIRRENALAGHPTEPVLMDFGAAKQNFMIRHSRSLAPFTPGYAAFEQETQMGELGTWTDLYAIGALMWRIVAGGCQNDSRLLVTDGSRIDSISTPPWSPEPRRATQRSYNLNRGFEDPMPSAMELGSGRFSPYVLKAIDHCLALYPEERVQRCEDLLDMLQVSSTLSPKRSYGLPDSEWNNPESTRERESQVALGIHRPRVISKTTRAGNAFNNQWRKGRVSWASLDSLTLGLPNQEGFSGVLPLPLVLDPKIGSEVVLLIIDRTDFAYEIARLEPFRLNIQSGLVPCPSGPVLFFLFWLANPKVPQDSLATFECTVNPHNADMMQPYWELARQTHWHVFVIGPGGEELNWFEFENEFNLELTLQPVSRVIAKYPCDDFEAAKLEFQTQFSLDDLFTLSGHAPGSGTRPIYV